MAEIKVIGIGSSGCKAVKHMIDEGLGGVDFILMDIEAQNRDLPGPVLALKIGWRMMRHCKGTPKNTEPEVGEQAAQESMYNIRAVLRGAEVAILVAGLGGGTGSGATGFIAAEARKLNVLPIVFTTTPFTFEGSRRKRIAKQGMNNITKSAGSLFNISLARLLAIIDGSKTLDETYQLVDHLIYRSVKGLLDLIYGTRMVDLKLADLKPHLDIGGYGMISFGEGSGATGATEALRQALDSPLLEWPIRLAYSTLLSMTGRGGARLNSYAHAAVELMNKVKPDMDVVYNTAFTDHESEQVGAVLYFTGLPATDKPPI